jgi:hypothetical protein
VSEDLANMALPDLLTKRAELEREVVEIGARLEANRALLTKWEDAQAWLALPDCRLEPNACTRLHKLVDAMRSRELLNGDTKELEPASDALLAAGAHGTFVVRHDWVAAFGDSAADVGADELRLPYPHCAFEFRINGRSLIVVTMEVPPDIQRARADLYPITAIPFVEIDGTWVLIEKDAANTSPATKLAWEEVRAICVALDAGVATYSTVPAPARLNRKRAAAGACPVFSHSVVDLAKKYRPTGRAKSDGTHQKRLHFRRGHWRHYEERKIWIKWMLVGNPDLGFIEHHYSL